MKITTELGPDALLLTGLRGYEGISQLFHFELELLSDRNFPPPFEKLLGKSATAEVNVGGVRRVFNGIVRKLTQLRRDDTFAYFRAELAPQLWLWTRRTNSRIFQQLSVPDVLRQVLAGLKVTFDLTTEYPPRDYCVQYRETDFDFASRLMEEEGLYYFFRHSDDGHEMVITDSRFQAPDLPEPAALVYDPVAGGTRFDLRVTQWEKSQELCASRYAVRDYSFEVPAQTLDAAEGVQRSVQAGMVEHTLALDATEKLELYDYPGGYAKRFDGIDPGGGNRSADLAHLFTENKRTACVRMEEEAAASLRITGEANAPHLTPGHKFSLMRHFDADGAYLLTRVEHEATLAAGYRSSENDQGLQYRSRFHCLPADLQFRPRRNTPRPRIDGVQTATVVGPAGQEIFCDKYGRIKVQFPWDREGKADARSSCWIRVAQFWAGRRWGAFFWPRVGHEVLVAFEEGDPDQPVVVGSLYNAANMPPFELPEKASGCGIKSCSVGGDPAEQYNCLVFHDQPGDEHVHLHSETHEVFTSEASQFRRTPGPHVEVVGSLLGIGSGSGGGMLEWPMGIGHAKHAGFTDNYAHLFPGSQRYVFGSNHTATMLGDTSSHTLGGANTTIIVDVEDMLFGTLFDHLGAVGPWVGAVLCGAGGRTALIAGSNNTLTYSGPVLNVARGETYQYHTESFWRDVTPVGLAVKALVLLASGSALAGDLCAALKAHTDEHGQAEYPEWATLLATGVSSRFIALLMVLEKKQAQAQAAMARAADAAKEAQQATDLATLALQVNNSIICVADAVEHNLQSAIDAAAQATAGVKAIALEAARTDRVLEGDYSLTAKNLSLTSRSNSPGQTRLTISAEGGPPGSDGFLYLLGSQRAMMQSGGAIVSTSDMGATSNINLGNAKPGTITVQQAPDPGGPAMVMDGVAQSLKLSVGPPGVGASIELSTAEGITIKYALWSLTLNAEGITAKVGENSMTISPASVMFQGLNLQNDATIQWLADAVQVAFNASAELQEAAAISQVQ